MNHGKKDIRIACAVWRDFGGRCWIHFASENPSMHTLVISSLRFLYLYMLLTFIMLIKTVTFNFLGFTIVFY